ncbi:MAG TPA: delta-60 repeat domain-containing protein, partial [Verrucomicrobiales bacterium]|nr:delta-60 repeat domain-containing protein [Verrucomicrobiales bacterium]
TPMKVLTCFAAAMLLGECTSAHAQTAGSLDPIFNTTVTDIGTGSITSFVEQPDGKIWIGGHFREVGGTFKFNLARLFPDGSLETNNISANDGVEALVHQPDGKMIVAGNFSGVNSGTETRNKIARLNADGSMEAASTFNIGNGANYTISCAALQPDGKILLGGTFTTFNLSQRNHLVRLNANGSVESTTTFNAGTGTNGDIFSIVVQPDGKILIAGLFTSVNGQPRNRIARLLPNGSLEDTGTFNPGAGANDIVYCLSLQPDGKILAGGKFTSFGGQTRNRIARLNPDGTLESTATFDPGAGTNDYLNCFALQTDGKILVGGSFTQMNGQTRNGLARLLPNGSLESTATFQTGTGVSGGEVPGVRSIAVQSNGKILIGGYFDKVNGTTRYGMARLFNDPATHRLSVEGGRVQWLRGGSSPEASNVNFELSTNGGTVWSSLGAGTRIAGGWERTGVSLPAAGQIRARGRTAGGIYGVSSGIVEEIASFGPGSLDVSFSPVLQGGVSGSFVNALAVQPDGKILIGGDFLTIDGQSRTNIARLLADGSVEPLSTFAIGSGASSDLSSLIVQPDGKILAAGRFNQLNGRARPFIGRLLPDGSVEGSATFTTGTGPANVVFASAIQPDGKILIAGNFHSVDGHSRNYIARLEAGGAVESSSTFNVGTGADSYITALAVQPDGRILAGGDFSNFNGQARGRIVRLLSNGTLETTAAFNTGSGANAQVSCLAVQPDGKILVGGAFTTIDGRTRNRIARLNTDGSLESSTTFPSGTGANGSLSSILLQADGKIIVGGGFTTFNDLPRNQVTRLLTSGVPESLTVFNTGSGFDQVSER